MNSNFSGIIPPWFSAGLPRCKTVREMSLDRKVLWQDICYNVLIRGMEWMPVENGEGQWPCGRLQ